MALPTISVINFSGNLEDREVQNVIRAVNRQISEDFASVWGATIFGQQQALLGARMRARQKMFEYDRPRLENEAKVQAIIEKVRSNPPSALRARGGAKPILRGVEAITRTARKQLAAKGFAVDK